MRDSFTYQTKEAVQLQEIMIPLDSWLDSKKIGDVYFYNYTEATIVAVVTKEEGRADTSPGPDYVLHAGDKLIFVSKDTMTFDRVASFLVYGVEE